MTTLAPLVKTVVVAADPETAFRSFTAEMAEWWPLATHSVGEDTATGVSVAPGVGGEIVEVYGGGRTAVWGTVTEWDPPHVVAFTWHPGRAAAAATAVRVAFVATAGGTEVTLTHTGWERHPGAAGARERYDSGWDLVLGGYADRIG